MTATKECMVMNFDDRTRVIHDRFQKPVAIGIGEVKTAELDGAVIDFLTNAMKKNDPLVILESNPDLPAEVQEIFAIMRELNLSDYDAMLTRATAIVGTAAFSDLRPSRAEIAHKLRVVAQRFAYEGAVPPKKELEHKEPPREVKDDVDPDQLDADLRKQKEAEQRDARDKKPRRQAPSLTPEQQRMNDALGIGGADVSGLAAALGENEAARTETPADEDGFDPKQGRPERPTRKPGAKKAAPKKSAPTASAAGKKSAAKAPAKQSVKRYRS